MMILAGDIGGTKTNLALFSFLGERPTTTSFQSFRSKDFPSLQSLVLEFLRTVRGEITSACFGLPCPVVEGRSETPNLPWSIDLDILKSSLRIKVIP